MKLLKRLAINGVKAELESEEIRLRWLAPGSASFRIRTPLASGAASGEAPEAGAAVSFSLAWEGQGNLNLYFAGSIDRVVPAGDKLYKIFCVETSAALDAVLPLSLRHPTLKDVLQAYAAKTGLAFITPERPYVCRRVPAFYALGSGLHGLAGLGEIFSIPDYFWQTQGDGKIFVGSYADSFWAGKSATLSPQFFTSATASGSRRVPALPALRPGAELNGARASEVVFTGECMEVTFVDETD